MSASGRKRVRRDDASSAHDIFETELAEILRRPDGTPGDRLHLATDLWETTQQKFPTAVPGFFTRLRGWVNDSFADDAAERLLFNRVQQMDGPAVAEEVRTIPSVDEEEADDGERQRLVSPDLARLAHPSLHVVLVVTDATQRACVACGAATVIA